MLRATVSPEMMSDLEVFYGWTIEALESLVSRKLGQPVKIEVAYDFNKKPKDDFDLVFKLTSTKGKITGQEVYFRRMNKGDLEMKLLYKGNLNKKKIR